MQSSRFLPPVSVPFCSDAGCRAVSVCGVSCWLCLACVGVCRKMYAFDSDVWNRIQLTVIARIFNCFLLGTLGSGVQILTFQYFTGSGLFHTCWGICGCSRQTDTIASDCLTRLMGVLHIYLISSSVAAVSFPWTLCRGHASALCNLWGNPCERWTACTVVNLCNMNSCIC